MPIPYRGSRHAPLGTVPWGYLSCPRPRLQSGTPGSSIVGSPYRRGGRGSSTPPHIVESCDRSAGRRVVGFWCIASIVFRIEACCGAATIQSLARRPVGLGWGIIDDEPAGGCGDDVVVRLPIDARPRGCGRARGHSAWDQAAGVGHGHHLGHRYQCRCDLYHGRHGVNRSRGIIVQLLCWGGCRWRWRPRWTWRG